MCYVLPLSQSAPDVISRPVNPVDLWDHYMLMKDFPYLFTHLHFVATRSCVYVQPSRVSVAACR